MDRSDVFISYRRTNVEFVKKLDQSFKKLEREVWVDWEDIPPGSVGFSEDIRRGIEGADAFVAVLSPDYLDSTYCVDLELGYAVELNKRIIPIVYEKFDGKPIPDSIGHINWVYFVPHAGQANPYDEAFQRVVDAMDADHDYVKMHTTLTTRAREWESRGHNRSFLLSGDAIAAAEAWMAKGFSANPPPSELQSMYIQESRKAANARQRRLMGVAGVAVVIFAILAVLAVFGAREAERQRQIAAQNEIIANQQRDLANDNAQKAQALSIASRAELALDGNEPEQSVLFGLEAINLSFSVAAERALHRGVTENRLLAELPNRGTVTRLIWSPDDEVLITTQFAEEESVRVWNVETREMLAEYAGNGIETVVEAIPNTSWFILKNGNTLEIRDFNTLRIINSVDLADDAFILSMKFSPDGQYLAVTFVEGVQIVSVNGLQTLATLTGATDIVWLPDSTGYFLKRPLADDPANGEYALYRIGNATPERTVFGTDLAVSPDSAYVTVTNYDINATEVWDLSSTVAQPLGIVSGGAVLWSEDAGSGTFLTRTFIDSAEEIAVWQVNDLSRPVFIMNAIDAFFSRNGHFLLVQLTRPSGLTPPLYAVYDADNFEEAYRLSGNLTFSPDGTLIAETSMAEDRIRIRDAASGRQLFFVIGHRGTLAWSTDGTMVALAGTGELSVWDATLSPSEFIFEGGEHVWSPDNTRLLTSRDPLAADDVFDTFEWELEDGTQIARAGGINPQWSPDNVHYVTEIGLQLARDFPLERSTLLHVSGGGRRPIEFAGGDPSFSYDGAYFTTSIISQETGEALETTVYDIVTLAPVVTLRGGNPQWSPVANTLLTSRGDAPFYTGDQRQAWLWDAAQPDAIASVPGSNTQWSLDGRFFTTELRGEFDSEGNQTVRTNIFQAWDFQLNGTVDGTLQEWSPDSTLAAFHSEDMLSGDSWIRILRLWNVETRTVQTTIPLPVNELVDEYPLAFSPDGTKLAYSSLATSDNLYVYEIGILAPTGHIKFNIDLTRGDSINPALDSVEWSPDSRFLIAIMTDSEVLEERVIVRDLQDVTAQTTVLDEEAYAVSWSPNAQRLVTASRNGVATVWHIPENDTLINIPLKSGNFYEVEWSPDGKFIVVTSDSETVLWRFFQSTEDLIAEAQRCCVWRDLSDEERLQLNVAGSDPELE